VNYWENGAYLGIGPSAVSKVGNTRAGNIKGTGAYVRRIAEGGDARAWSETPPAAKRLAETWWLGLRLREGVRPADARLVAGLEGAHDPAFAVAERLEEDGLLERNSDRLRLTRRGLPLADWIAKRFLERAGED
jgi:oxygen-independent coproporphyrinogen-3 oxidase